MGQAHATVAFTGSVRQCLHHPSGVIEWATPRLVAKNVDEFIERVSRRFLRRKSVRAHVQLRCACVVEGGREVGGQRLHAHLMVGGFPRGEILDVVQPEMIARWTATRWGYEDAKVEPLGSSEDRRRWAEYLVKEFGHGRDDRWFFNYPYQKE
jgi:hypothetical protein